MSGKFSRRAVVTSLGSAGLGLSALPAGAVPRPRILPPSAIDGGLRFQFGNQRVDVLCTGERTFSVIKRPLGQDDPALGFFVPPSTELPASIVKGNAVHSGGAMARIDPKTGAIAFRFGRKTLLVDLGSEEGARFKQSRPGGLFGLGQFRDALPNYLNRSVYLAQANYDAICPLLVSPDGFGLLWDTGTDSHFSSRGTGLSFSNPSPITRFHVFLGESIDDIVASYRKLTGRAPMLPKYAYGFWQSQERYNTQAELTNVLDGYRARQLPVDVMMQDWGYWGGDEVFSGMVWTKERFPDPKALAAHVHAKNAHIVATVWPAFGPKSEVFKELERANLLLKNKHWSGSRVLDITSPDAQNIYWQHIRDGLLSIGLDGLWTDGCEPEFMSTGNRYVTTQSYVSNGDAYVGPLRHHALTFSYYQSRLLYTKMRELRPDKRPFTLTRSAYAGQQAFNAITWSGDIFAGWETLRHQIIAAQQISLSGIPYWTNDIGAFLVRHRFPEGLQDKTYRELYVRWFQFAAFLPIFRAHGTEIRRELWAMGEAGEPHFDALKIALERRYALMPYIYALAAKVTHEHETVLRPLIMDFGNDKKIDGYSFQYMFGRDILVCPVYTPIYHDQIEPYEFIPNYAIVGANAPAAEVEFFEGVNFDRSVERRSVDDLKMSWFGDLPAALKGKPYSAIWRGRIIAQESGRHKLRLITQGLVRFSLDGQVKVASTGAGADVVNAANGAVSFAGHKGDDIYYFEADLVDGRAYDFELIQNQSKPDAVSLWVEWITPSHAKDMTTSPDKAVKVYLPIGQDWYALGTTTLLKGGQVLTLRPDLKDIPLFVRAGAILPMTPGIQHAGDDPKQLELHIYPGRNGNAELYDDAGDGYGYQDGMCSRTALNWDNGSRTLQISQATGTYPGMPTQRTFRCILHAPTGPIVRFIVAPTAETTKLSF